MDWNVKRIINDFGGSNDLHAALVAEGHQVTVRAVRQWWRRDNIPANWLAILLSMQKTNLPKGWVSEDIF